MEKVFPEDILSKKERVLRTLNHQGVDRVAIHEQLSYNGRVIAHYTGRNIEGFEDMCTCRTLQQRKIEIRIQHCPTEQFIQS